MNSKFFKSKSIFKSNKNNKFPKKSNIKLKMSLLMLTVPNWKNLNQQSHLSLTLEMQLHHLFSMLILRIIYKKKIWKMTMRLRNLPPELYINLKLALQQIITFSKRVQKLKSLITMRQRASIFLTEAWMVTSTN